MENLDDIGLQDRLGNVLLKVVKRSLVIFKAMIQVTKADAIFHQVTEASSAEYYSTIKWHRRLAHVSEKGLQILYKKRVFGKDHVSKISFREDCTLGKQHRLHINTGKQKSTSTLE